jgi:hypothetical protein
MAAAPTQTTASPLDSHASPVADRPAGAGKTRHGRATAALIISIIGILFALFFALIGLILSIIGTVMAATARSDIRRRGMIGAGQAKAALICGVVGIVLNVASMIVGAIIMSS